MCKYPLRKLEDGNGYIVGILKPHEQDLAWKLRIKFEKEIHTLHRILHISQPCIGRLLLNRNGLFE